MLSGLGAHFLAYTITRRHDAAAVAGVAFAFAPYRLAQPPHIQVLASFWTPVCLAALHRYGSTARTRWILIAVSAWVIQALSCGYYLFFLAALLALWFLWFALGRWPIRRLALAVAAFAAGALLLAPLFRGYQVILQDTYGFKRSIGEIRFFSADVAGLLLRQRRTARRGDGYSVFQRPESNLFPGLTIVLLAIAALYRAHPLPASPPTRAACGSCDVRLSPLLIVLLPPRSSPSSTAHGADGRRGPAGIDRARRQAADARSWRRLALDGLPAADARGVPSPLGAGFLSSRRRSRCGCSRLDRIRPSWIIRRSTRRPTDG